jgi:uncharacterized protein YbcC (UPF0753/DUF2309 family)
MLELETKEAAKSLRRANLLRHEAKQACLRFAPVWNLTDYVAVNPFLGFAGQHVADAAKVANEGLDAHVLPLTAFYRSRWIRGDFGFADLAAAARRAGWSAESLEAVLDGQADIPRSVAEPVLTLAERHDRDNGTDWNDTVLRAAARWCAVHAEGGGKYWKTGGRPDLFGSWHEAASADRSLEILGLRGFRAWLKGIPDVGSTAFAEAVQRSGVHESLRVAYFYRLLGGLYGWASYYRRLAWEIDPNAIGQMSDLLAIRLVLDTAVAELAPDARRAAVMPCPRPVEDEAARLVFQDALEDGYARRLLGRFAPPPSQGAEPAGTRPALQAVFCIDVRSEPLRRHLEAESEAIETRGFAGFFGVALNWHGPEGESARCPVLLKPACDVKAQAAPGGVFDAAVPYLQGAPAAAFSYVEIGGAAYALKLAGDALAVSPEKTDPAAESPFALGLDAEARVNLAAGILKNMGFGHDFARLVLLCGHEGHSANNPHAAGLDCGACGGHGGAVNARVAASVLNDPGVRIGLAQRGRVVPADTHFLPAVHDTTTDDVRLLDVDLVPPSHQADLAKTRAWLARAGANVARERAERLGLGAEPSGRLRRLLKRRSRDWSEVRPEWALARNAAFVAARRARTRGANLEGRAFLHEYDASADADDSVLTLILTAPMVVASWINLQYFGSTVDNGVFGSGDKTVHNRVGSLGVVLGNGGDIRTGMAMQSVTGPDGSWFHEPLRLQVVVEAPREKIDRVLEAQPGVRELVEHGWVRIFSLHPEREEAYLYVPARSWEKFDAVAKQSRDKAPDRA